MSSAARRVGAALWALGLASGAEMHVAQRSLEAAEAHVGSAGTGEGCGAGRPDRAPAAGAEAQEDWLTVTGVAPIGELHGRRVAKVSWQCSRDALPSDRQWLCLKPGEQKEQLFYASSGYNSGADGWAAAVGHPNMTGTWTPFTEYTGKFEKLSVDGCWQNWQAMSPTLCQYHGPFVRFGTTDPRQQPKFSPAEAVVVSRSLGGGIWERAGWAARLAVELRAPAPAAWSPGDQTWKELADEDLAPPPPDFDKFTDEDWDKFLADSEGVYDDLSLMKWSPPPGSALTDADTSQMHYAMDATGGAQTSGEEYEGHPDRCFGQRAFTCKDRDFTDFVPPEADLDASG